MLVFGAPGQELLNRCGSVEPVGWLDNPFNMPEESGQTLWLCRDLGENLQQLWPRLRHYDRPSPRQVHAKPAVAKAHQRGRIVCSFP